MVMTNFSATRAERTRAPRILRIGTNQHRRILNRTMRLSSLLLLIPYFLWCSASNAQQYTGGAVHQWWLFPEKAWNVDAYMQPQIVSNTVYFSHQWFFEDSPNGNDGAYMGLQRRSPGQSSVAIFSIWNATSASSHCTDFGGEGIGKRCMIDYPFEIGRWYLLRVWRLSNNSNRGHLWGAWVIDDKGRETHIGNILAPAGTGDIASSVSFVEYWGPAADCGKLPPSAAYMYQPVLNAKRSRGSASGTSQGDCAAGRVTSLDNGRISRLDLRWHGKNKLAGTYRLNARWEPSTGYIARGGSQDSNGNWQPGSGAYLTQLTPNSTTWSSMKWRLEPAGYGRFRLINLWGESTGFLTRGATKDGAGVWRPNNSFYLTSPHYNWGSQKWRLVYATPNIYYLSNQWSPSNGYLTRAGNRVGDSWVPSNRVHAYSKQNWSSQRWSLHKLSGENPKPPKLH